MNTTTGMFYFKINFNHFVLIMYFETSPVSICFCYLWSKIVTTYSNIDVKWYICICLLTNRVSSRMRNPLVVSTNSPIVAMLISHRWRRPLCCNQPRVKARLHVKERTTSTSAKWPTRPPICCTQFRVKKHPLCVQYPATCVVKWRRDKYTNKNKWYTGLQYNRKI